MAGIIGKTFTAADIGESEVWSLDFARVLDPGEQITSVAWTSSKPTVLQPIGSPVITGTIVSQRHQALAGGYSSLGCMVHTSTGNDRHLFAQAQVLAAAT